MRCVLGSGVRRSFGIGLFALLARCNGATVGNSATSSVQEAPLVAASALSGAPTALTCSFSKSCPPGEYNLTPQGYVASSPSAGCSTTPPASCTSSAPPFTAPVITSVVDPMNPATWPGASVVAGAHTIYAIGIPSAPLDPKDNRSAVFAWCDNTYGQLGDGTTISSTSTSAPVVPIFVPDRPVLKVAAGDTDACAILEGNATTSMINTVHCWGEIATLPTAATYPLQRQITFPGSDPSIVGIAHGQHHACALSEGGRVFCWGNNNKGQLGVPPSVASGVDATVGHSAAVEVKFPSAIGSAGQPNQSQVYPIVIYDIAASGDSTCALASAQDPVPGGIYATNQNYIWCWGDKEQGSLGNGAASAGNSQAFEPAPVMPTALTLDGTMAVSFQGPLVAGSNGSPGKGGTFCAKTIGSAQRTPSWFCWGSDAYGQVDIPTPAHEGSNYVGGITTPTPQGDAATQSAPLLAIGANHGCAGGLDGTTGSATPLYCFGDNDSGQLGISDSNENWPQPWAPANEP